MVHFAVIRFDGASGARRAMPADSRREKKFDFVREFAVKYFRIVPVRDSTQQNKA